MQYNRQCIRFRLIESVKEPEIMLPLGTTILYDNTSVREDKFLSRFDSIVQQPVSKSILFCALNDLPLSEDEDVKDYLDGKNESDNFSGNKHLSPFFLEIIGIFEKKNRAKKLFHIKKILLTGFLEVKLPRRIILHKKGYDNYIRKYWKRLSFFL